MNYWRMAMRIGNQGDDMFEDCRCRGIAAISYVFGGKKPIGDCRKLGKQGYLELWRHYAPKDITGRTSLRRVAFEMKKGDIIYVKKGPRIVCKGKITGEYQHDPKILKGTQAEWEHFVTVDWDESFLEFTCLLGAEQWTVLPLTGARLTRLLKAETKAQGQTGTPAKGDARRLHICVGRAEDHADLLTRAAMHGKVEYWTINSKARPGDEVLFYMLKPMGAFFARGTVRSSPVRWKRSGLWNGFLMSKVQIHSVLTDPVPIEVVGKRIPNWGWPRSRLRSTTVPPKEAAQLRRLLSDGVLALPATNHQHGAGFGDADTNRWVERAAIDAVSDWFRRHSWAVASKEADKVGYDLLCRRKGAELHVEVKGTSGSVEQFIVTAGEVRRATTDQRFLLCVVINALSDTPTIFDHPGRSLCEDFKLEPTQYRATLR